MAKWRQFMATKDTKTKKREEQATIPFLYDMQAFYPRAGIALTPPIPVLDNEPITNSRSSHFRKLPQLPEALGGHPDTITIRSLFLFIVVQGKF